MRVWLSLRLHYKHPFFSSFEKKESEIVNFWAIEKNKFSWLCQSINQSMDGPINQSTNQWMDQSINRSDNGWTNQSMDRSINRSNTGRTNQSIDRRMSWWFLTMFWFFTSQYLLAHTARHGNAPVASQTLFQVTALPFVLQLLNSPVFEFNSEFQEQECPSRTNWTAPWKLPGNPPRWKPRIRWRTRRLPSKWATRWNFPARPSKPRHRTRSTPWNSSTRSRRNWPPSTKVLAVPPWVQSPGRIWPLSWRDCSRPSTRRRPRKSNRTVHFPSVFCGAMRSRQPRETSSRTFTAALRRRPPPPFDMRPKLRRHCFFRLYSEFGL